MLHFHFLKKKKSYFEAGKCSANSKVEKVHELIALKIL